MMQTKEILIPILLKLMEIRSLVYLGILLNTFNQLLLFLPAGYISL